MEQNIEDLIIKVRRRVVAFLNSPSVAPKIIVRAAKICGVKIPNEVEKKYGSNEP